MCVPLVTSRRERPTHVDLVELAEVHGLEAVDGRPDVLAVRALLHHLQLANTRHVGQPGLDLGHVRDLGDRDRDQERDQDQDQDSRNRNSRSRTTEETSHSSSKRVPVWPAEGAGPADLDLVGPGVDPLPQQPPA